MKLVKSLLLGSAAGLLAVASSQAADLPYKKAAPVEYVKICDAHGAGFFYIPGTDTCLKVGGDVEFYLSTVANGKTFAGYSNSTGVVGAVQTAKGTNATGFNVRGRVQIDARNTTAYGTLRAFVSSQINYKSGIENTSASPGSATNAASLDKAYMQFAGFTAGYYQSIFDFYADDWNHWDLDDSDTSIDGLAYTATFGGGFSATIAIEDRSTRLGNVSAGSFSAAANTGLLAGVPGGVGGVADTALWRGYVYPDGVGQVNLSQAWGQVQLSGAVHDDTSYLVAATPVGTASVASKSKLGYAAQLGVEVNLPTLAAGDQLWLEGAYTQGALSYVQAGNERGLGNSAGSNQIFNGGIVQTDYDVVWTPGGAKLTEAWAVMAAFQHYFTPTIVGRLTGSYLDVHYPSGAALDAATSSYNRFKIGPQLYWLPVAGFQIGVETLYIRQEDKFPAGVILAPGEKKDVDGYEATLHVERDF